MNIQVLDMGFYISKQTAGTEIYQTLDMGLGIRIINADFPIILLTVKRTI